jgi:hypothetical protein
MVGITLARGNSVNESRRLRSARTLYLLGFALITLPAAFSQVSEPLIDPAESAAAGPAAGTPEKMDLIEKVLGIVGPSEPSHLTQKDRFQLYLLYAGGPLPLLGEAAGAGISHWRNSPHEWGQGWGAYGERYGSNLAYNGVRQTITYGVAIAFHEDNRYFASGKHGLWPRTGYAVLSSFTTRQPDGGQKFSVSGVSGVVGASAVASIWGPESWKGASNIAKNAGVSFGVTAAFNIFREFLPDILHRPRPEPAGGH